MRNLYSNKYKVWFARKLSWLGRHAQTCWVVVEVSRSRITTRHGVYRCAEEISHMHVYTGRMERLRLCHAGIADGHEGWW